MTYNHLFRAACPLCKKTYNKKDLLPNIPIRRLVNELSIRCINQKCTKVIKKGELLKHLAKCEFQLVNCSNSDACGLMERRSLKKHEAEKCLFRIIPCRLRCGIMLPFNTMEEHISTD